MPQLLADLSHDALARGLRAAVLGSDHAQAHRLAEQYAQAVASDWKRLSDSEITIMQHAMAGQHISALEMAHRYLAARANYATSARLEG
jgi:hypothetical protein